MDPVAAFAAILAGASSVAIGRLVAVASDTQETIPFAAQLGVGAVVIAVALYMLRRSDQRDAVSRALEQAAIERERAVLQAQLELERKRADAAEERNEVLEERLIDSYRQSPPTPG